MLERSGRRELQDMLAKWRLCTVEWLLKTVCVTFSHLESAQTMLELPAITPGEPAVHQPEDIVASQAQALLKAQKKLDIESMDLSKCCKRSPGVEASPPWRATVA